MKSFTTTLLLLISLLGLAQDQILSPIFGFKTSTPRSEITRFHITSLIMFTTGVTVDTHDNLTNVPDLFFATFPNANRQFWDPRISWKNKYKNGNPNNGPKFFGSTESFVGATDGWHPTNTFTHIQIGAIISLTYFQKDTYRKITVWQGIARIAYLSGCYYLGYNAADKLIYHHY